MLLRRLGPARIVCLALSLGCATPAPEGALPRLEGPLPAPSAPPAPPAAAGMPDAAASRLVEPATVHDVEAFLVAPSDPFTLPDTPPVAEAPSSTVVEPPPTFGGHRPMPPLLHLQSGPPLRLPPEVVQRIRRVRAQHLANVRACCAATHERAAVAACLRAKEPPRDGGMVIDP